MVLDKRRKYAVLAGIFICWSSVRHIMSQKAVKSWKLYCNYSYQQKPCALIIINSTLDAYLLLLIPDLEFRSQVLQKDFLQAFH